MHSIYQNEQVPALQSGLPSSYLPKAIAKRPVPLNIYILSVPPMSLLTSWLMVQLQHLAQGPPQGQQQGLALALEPELALVQEWALELGQGQVQAPELEQALVQARGPGREQALVQALGLVQVQALGQAPEPLVQEQALALALEQAQGLARVLGLGQAPEPGREQALEQAPEPPAQGSALEVGWGWVLAVV
jgi:hypothetical protein